MCSLTPTGSDYIVNTENPPSRTFTVFFTAKKSNSSEFVLMLTNDSTLEDREYFRIQIIAIRFTGQLGDLFRVQDGVNNTFVDVSIEDNDGKSFVCQLYIHSCRDSGMLT